MTRDQIVAFSEDVTKRIATGAIELAPITEKQHKRIKRRSQHELLPFLVLWAIQYQKDYGLNGLHPTHYDLMVKYGARMVDFRRASNASERMKPLED